MGQKINPVGLRLQVNRTWESRWFSNTKEYGDLLHEDLEIRKFIKKNCAQSGISRVIIERPHKKCRVTIYAARPGVIIGKKKYIIKLIKELIPIHKKIIKKINYIFSFPKGIDNSTINYIIYKKYKKK